MDRAKGKLSVFNKIIYFGNYIFATLLLVGYILPYIKPKTFSALPVLSLFIPVLIGINVVFILFWLIQLKKQFFLSAICLVVGFFVSSSLYNFKAKNDKITNNEFSVMNFNVRLFNAYNWIDDKTIPKKIKEFISKENPSILTMQEFHPIGEELINYPYKFINTKGKNKKFGQAIFSKYRIINQGSLDFKNTQNNAIFIDIVRGIDTIRIYNLHLESLGLNPNKENLGQKNSEKLFKRLRKEFLKQQEQVEQIIEHQAKTDYPIIVLGDFNNTAYSWAYKKLKQNFKDTFLEAGKGFGATFDFKNLPLRIDFIFVDKVFTVKEHKNYNINYSDHNPIFSRIGLD